MSSQTNRSSHSGDSDRRKCGTRHVPTLDRRVAARICRHHASVGLRITIVAGVADLSFRLPVSTLAEVRAMREVRRHTAAFHVHNPQHRAALAVAR